MIWYVHPIIKHIIFPITKIMTVTVIREQQVINTPCLSKWFAISPGITHPITLNSADWGIRTGKNVCQTKTQRPAVISINTNLLFPNKITKPDINL